MSNLDDFIDSNESLTSELLTPESIAWKLLLSDDLKIGNYGLQTFTDEEDTQDDPTSFLFELLLTIYFEMVFCLDLLVYLNNNPSKTQEDYTINLENVTLETLQEPFGEKFKIINYSLNVLELTNEEFMYLKKHCWCKIYLRDNPSDSTIFELNKDYVDPTKRYFIVRNGSYVKSDNLSDVFGLCNIGNNKYFKISFSSLLIPTVHQKCGA